MKTKPLSIVRRADALFNRKHRGRKRDSETVSGDRLRAGRDKNAAILDEARLGLLEQACEHRNDLPDESARAIVHEVAQHVAMLLDNLKNTSQVPVAARPHHIASLHAILSRVDPKIIASFDAADVEEVHRLAMLALADENAERVSKAELIDFDTAQETVCVRYFFIGTRPDFSVRVGATEVAPTADKIRIHRVLDRTMVREYIGWFSWRSSGLLTFHLNGKSCGPGVEQHVKESAIAELTSSDVDPKHLPIPVRAKRFFGQLPIFERRFRGVWLLMDRDTQADDNAEHLYRYIKAQRPDINVWFVLRKTSHDWGRLKSDGFQLIAFGSAIHKVALLHAKHVISSHIDLYVTSNLPPQLYDDLTRWSFTYLRHGVGNWDQSDWLNGESVRHFITSARDEYDSLCADDTPYKFTTREVALTGLPRHDRLIRERSGTRRNTILIMPTWRKNLVGQLVGISTNDRVKNPEFVHSDFYRSWLAFISSPELKYIASHYDHEIVFFPHANLEPYIEDFRSGPIKVIGHSDIESIQDLFLQASVLITDYSSVAFEMAYLERPVLYYQFDEQQMFGGGHGVQRGYFDYRTNGFGPVCTEPAELFQALETILKNQGEIDEPYRQRMRDFFAFRDGRCCERVVKVIEGP